MVSDRQLEQLGLEIVEQIRPILPEDCTVEFVHGDFVAHMGGLEAVIDFGKIVQQPNGKPAFNVEAALSNVLSSLQDFIIVQLRAPWPAPERGSSDLPVPHVEVSWPKVGFWFGESDRPALSFDDLEIAAG